MIEKMNYLQPEIEVIDLVSLYGYCMDFDPTVSGAEQLGKSVEPAFEDETENDADKSRSLWDN